MDFFVQTDWPSPPLMLVFHQHHSALRLFGLRRTLAGEETRNGIAGVFHLDGYGEENNIGGAEMKK